MTPQAYRPSGHWRKSSHSDGNGGNCVEIGVLDLVPVTGDWRKSSRSGNGGEACVEVGVLDLAPLLDAWRKSTRSTANGDCVEVGTLDLPPAIAAWRKSTHSNGNGGECVEVGVPGDVPARLLAIRDSKDPDGPRLHVTPAAWAAFTADVAAGAYDHLR